MNMLSIIDMAILCDVFFFLFIDLFSSFTALIL